MMPTQITPIVPDQGDAWMNATVCDAHGTENCEHPACLSREHLSTLDESATAFPDSDLEDVVDVAEEGRALAMRGVPFLLAGIIPMLGMLGFLVAFAKVGKTTFGQALAAHVALGLAFLDRATTAAKVLVIAAEDPPEYTGWLARHLPVSTRGRLYFRRKPLVLDDAGLSSLCATVRHGGFGLVLIASWQAVVRGLIRDENDNAGAVQVVERVKLAARRTGVPWLIDAHSGKGEDLSDDADPSRAMRGASSAAGAADYTLSLRYANGTFGSQRKLSGKGRFVDFAPITIDFNPADSTYEVVGTTKDLQTETTWRQICETGALNGTPRSLAEIGKLCGLMSADDTRLKTSARRQLQATLSRRGDVLKTEEMRRGQKTTLYRRDGGDCD